MNLKEYIKLQITTNKQPDLKLIYQELLNTGYSAKEIYTAINEQIQENINMIITNYLKKKNENN